MTYRDNDMLMDALLGVTSEVKVSSAEKEVYEKPTLAIVKFMFESDITWGSFETGNEGDNEASIPDGWWG